MAAAIAAFVVASLYGVAIAVFRRDRSRVAHDYGQKIGHWIPPLLNIRVHVTHAERLEAHRPCIFIGNHQSLLDVPVLARCYAPGSVVIGKKQLTYIPFFGWLYRVTGNLLIDRADNRQAVGRLMVAEEAIRERRVAVWIFPEGTRCRVPGRMYPFKKGGFYMAVHTGAPLVPVVTSPIRPTSDLRKLRLRPNDVEVRVLEPIPTAGLGPDDVPALMDEARRRMAAALDEMSVERGIAPGAYPPQLPPSRRQGRGGGGGPSRPGSSGGTSAEEESTIGGGGSS